MVEVSVVVLNYLQDDLTRKCVESVLASKVGFDFEVLVVDNCGVPGSLKFDDGRVRVLVSDENLFYAGGNNFGFDNVEGDYVLVLNNDTVVDDCLLGELYDFLEANEDCEAVSALEKRKLGGEYVDKCTSERRLNVFLHPVETKDVYDRCDVEIINGACFMMRRGWSFNSDYKIYAEETELALRMRRLGYKIGFCGSAVFWHEHNTVRKVDPVFKRLAEYLGERNRIWNFRQYAYHPVLGFFPLWFSLFGVLVLRPKYFKEHLRAWFDGWFGGDFDEKEEGE